MYSFPTRPMQLCYHEHGIQCDFTLMTVGEYRGGSITPTPAAVRQVSAAPNESASSHRLRQNSAQASNQPEVIAMPPPSEPASRSFTKDVQSQRAQRPSPPPPLASLDHESLFLPAEEDEDRLWGEKSYDNDQDTLGWNASGNRVGAVAICKVISIHEDI